MQHGPQLMVWGGMCSHGVTPLYRINGTLRSEEYKNILENVMLPSAASYFKRKRWLLIQDNSKVHTSKMMKSWLQKKLKKHLPRVTFPPNSPDLNVIENLWTYVQDKLNQRKFRTTNGLYKRAHSWRY